MRLFAGFSMLAAASCGAPPCRYGLEEAKTMAQDPAQLTEYFLDQVRCGEYANAYNHGLSKGAKAALSYEQFYLVIQWEFVRRMILGFEQHAVDRAAGTVRWCNAEMGVTREFRIAGMKIGTKTFWGLDFTREQLDDLKNTAFAWFEKQRAAADGRVYVYPPEWRYAPVGSRCTCKR
jgi:hypothetical protein